MAYVRITYPKVQCFDDNGLFAVDYEIHVFTAGTSTPATSYTDRELSVPNTNPVVLNARGEADIYTGSPLKLVFTEPSGDPDSPIWVVDYIGELESSYLTGEATPTTSSNAYIVDITPVPAALTNNMMLVWTPDIDNTDTMGATAHSTAGPNDCVFSGPYSGSTSSIFKVEIDAEGSPDIFKWRKDSEEYVTGVSITGDDQTLKEGISVNFAVLSGHTAGDYWTQAVDPPASLDLNSLGAKLIYKNVAGSLTLLDGGGLIADIPATVIYSEGQDCWVLLNTGDPVYENLVPNRIRFQTDSNYTLSADDHGNEINFTNSTEVTLTLPAAAEVADKFFYIRAGGAGNVKIDADGSELIYGRRKPAGNGDYYLIGGQGDTIQLATNGVDWHVMTEAENRASVQIFNYTGSSQTYTKPWDVRLAEVHVYGGGGGANAQGGGSGGGGGYSYKAILGSAIGATETVTIGSGGAGTGGPAGTATSGGTSSFGSHCSATGGGGGSGSNVGGAGGAGADGNINLTGQAGHYAYDSDAVYYFYGGACPGPMGGLTMPSLVGSNGSFPGGGAASGGTTAKNGANGLVVVVEYR